MFSSDAERRKYELLLEGAEFKVDNKKTWQVIKKLVAGMNSWSWIERFDKTEDGRGGYFALCTYYDGPGETEKVEAIARRDLNDLKYLGNEQAFSFEKFTTKLQYCFNILDEEFALEKTKVRAMFDRIHSSHPAIIATVAMVKGKAENKNSFVNAANDLSEAILQLFPTNKFSKRDRREINEMGRGRGGRGGRGDGGRGEGRGRGGTMTQPTNNKINGVDVSDPDRTFSKTEFEKIGDGGRL